MQSLFLSDLHLSRQDSEITARFEQFAHYCARQRNIQYLAILGDLFEYWIGDDYEDDFIFHIKKILLELSHYCQYFYLMRGNRDFLIGKDFCDQINAELLSDPFILPLDNISVLLMHGDTLCIDDIAYQNLRAQFQDPNWQAQVLSLPVEQRLIMAREFREQSIATQKQRGMRAQEYISDVNTTEVLRQMRNHQVSVLIHGHTHRPARHVLKQDMRQNLVRWVLPAWYGQDAGFLRYRNGKFMLEKIQTP